MDKFVEKKKKSVPALIWLLLLTICANSGGGLQKVFSGSQLLLSLSEAIRAAGSAFAQHKERRRGKYSGQFSACWIKCLINT